MAQFYLNWPEPHRPLPPTMPPITLPLNMPRRYRPLSLRDPAGDRAVVAGQGAQPNTTKIQLLQAANLDGVRAGRAAPTDHRDFVVFADDTAKPSKTYRILSVDRAKSEIVVSGTPAWSGAGRWRIQRRPRLVMIDPFFPRLGGAAATPVVGSPNAVTLDGNPDLLRVVSNFDTIFLNADRARPSKTYRIVGVDTAQKRVFLDAAPDFPIQVDGWTIPAGLTHEVRAESYPLTPRDDGCDHYDAVIFLVHDNALIASYASFTSYTSSKNTGSSLSSASGNNRFTFSSYRSQDKVTINYCFGLTDIRYDLNPPHYDALIDTINDKIAEGRYFFQGSTSNGKSPLSPILPDQPVTRDMDGKKFIRLHYGHEAGAQTGSDGCMVAPRVYDLRTRIIQLHQAERAQLGEAADANLTRVADATDHTMSTNLWKAANTVLYVQWSDRIMGEFILIRPDQRPTST